MKTMGTLMKSFTDRSRRLSAGLIALVGVATLPGCDYEHERYLRRADSITPGAGNAAAFNNAVHTIDPWPGYSRNANINMDGKKALIAVRRYQHDDVKMPRRAPYPDSTETPPLAPTASDPYGAPASVESEN